VLYVRVLKAIYGMIESALRWYELFSSTLTDMGFIINPYAKCTANEIINGSQCTVISLSSTLKTLKEHVS